MPGLRLFYPLQLCWKGYRLFFQAMIWIQTISNTLCFVESLINSWAKIRKNTRKNVPSSVFLRYIPQNGGRQNVQVRKIVDFSNFKRLYLRFETVSGEKSQRKNENFGALRAPAQTGRMKIKRIFFIFVSSDRSPQNGVFRVKQLSFQNKARGARGKFLGVFIEKQSPKCAG